LDFLKKQGKFSNEPEGNPVVVLLDIKMPKLSGLQVLERMKSDSMLKSIPVVMLTSSREEPDLARAYELGVNAYVVKPVDFTQFMEAIKQIGTFWAVINEPPPGANKKSAS